MKWNDFKFSFAALVHLLVEVINLKSHDLQMLRVWFIKITMHSCEEPQTVLVKVTSTQSPFMSEILKRGMC
jgi:hypothetical protein